METEKYSDLKTAAIIGIHFSNLIPEHEMERLRNVDKPHLQITGSFVDEAKFCIKPVQRLSDDLIYIPRNPERISKHRQARQDRFRARHK